MKLQLKMIGRDDRMNLFSHWDEWLEDINESDQLFAKKEFLESLNPNDRGKYL